MHAMRTDHSISAIECVFNAIYSSSHPTTFHPHCQFITWATERILGCFRIFKSPFKLKNWIFYGPAKWLARWARDLRRAGSSGIWTDKNRISLALASFCPLTDAEYSMYARRLCMCTRSVFALSYMWCGCGKIETKTLKSNIHRVVLQ